VDLDAGTFLYDPAHAAILFSPQSVAVLAQTPFQVFRSSNVNQLASLVVNQVDAGRTGKCCEEFRAEFPIEISDGHGQW